MATDQQPGYQGMLDALAGIGPLNAQLFMIRQIVAQIPGAAIVQVKACTNAGGVSAVGFVDVLPLVNQIDGSGNGVPHGIVRGLPYFRLQGGANAVIIDPQAGDIGIAVFAGRDLSQVKATRAQANPGSYRVHSMADGLYLGGVLNAAPTQYVQFSSSGVTILSPQAISLKAPQINLEGPVAQTGGAATFDTSVTSPVVDAQTSMSVAGKDVGGHYHDGVQPGSGNSGGMVN